LYKTGKSTFNIKYCHNLNPIFKSTKEREIEKGQPPFEALLRAFNDSPTFYTKIYAPKEILVLQFNFTFSLCTPNMASQTTEIPRSTQRHSLGAQLEVPMSVFNQSLVENVDLPFKHEHHTSTASGLRSSGSRNSRKAVYLSRLPYSRIFSYLDLEGDGCFSSISFIIYFEMGFTHVLMPYKAHHRSASASLSTVNGLSSHGPQVQQRLRRSLSEKRVSLSEKRVSLLLQNSYLIHFRDSGVPIPLNLGGPFSSSVFFSHLDPFFSSQPSSLCTHRLINTYLQSSKSHYTRPTGPELVSSQHPSCSGLPPTWNHIHDRFIAYLATHAPLDKNGKVPRYEQNKERWKSEDIARMVMERFEGLRCYVGLLESLALIVPFRG